jgi:hypothetical protein
VIALAQRFVPAADEVHRLQSGSDPDCRLFQAMAEHGHYAGRVQPSTTRQGIYALTPGGRFLASINSRSADQVLAMMEAALVAWQALTPEERLAPDAGLQAAGREAPRRFEALYPEDGLVLAVTTRDLPREDGTAPDDWRASAWNRDHAWFTAAEARAFVPQELAVGASSALPERLLRRLVCLHLVDSVRGQVLPFPPEAIERAELTSRVVAVDETSVHLELTGETRTAMVGTWPVGGFHDRDDPDVQARGFATRILGRAVWDRTEGRFRSFEMLALGTRWGGTQFNGRADDLDEAPIGVAFQLAGDERVAPALIWQYGW